MNPTIRPDILWTEHDHGWVAYDPLSASYFSFEQLDYQVAQLLDGTRSASEIVLQIQEEIDPAKDRYWLQQFLLRMKSFQMLRLSDRSSTRALVQQGRKQRQQTLAGFLASPLAIRIPLWNPRKALDRFGWLARIAFHRFAACFALACCLLALFLVARQIIVGGLGFVPDIAAMTGQKWLVLISAYLLAKSLHELGHGLACVHRKVDCNEVGILFLCFAPCFYCDTTDSWRLRSKWHRAQIAFAGIYVELILASAAAFVWLATRDGITHEVAAAMMVVCSLGTLLVNANPLLKYDGYYVLSDLWGMPNLSELSREAVSQFWGRFLIGRKYQKNTQFRRKSDYPLLVCYGIAAGLYRVFILVLILWIVWLTLEPRGLGVCALLLVTVVSGSYFMMHFRSLWRAAKSIGPSFRWTRVVLASASITAVIWLCVTWPLPYSVEMRASTDFADRSAVYAAADGVLRDVSTKANSYETDQVLFRLESQDLEDRLRTLEHEIAVLNSDVELLERRSVVDKTASFLLPTKRQLLDDFTEQKNLLVDELASLAVKAPAPGRFIPTLFQRDAIGRSVYENETFREQLVQVSQTGLYVTRGDLLGQFITNESQVLCLALADGEQVRLLEPGMEVEVRWDSRASTPTHGTILQIADEPLTRFISSLVGDPKVASVRTEQGEYVPERPHYEVKIVVREIYAGNAMWKAPATVHVRVNPKSIVEHLHDWWDRNFRTW